jgi:heavy metal translocating P-type ATPase
MKSRNRDRLLFFVTTITLFLGILANTTFSHVAAETIWAIGGTVGLIPATKWLIDGFRTHEMGSDILAVLSLLGTLLTGEMFAAAVISLMLATGRMLESWAEGQAERQLKSLLLRLPRRAHVVNDDGSLTEINADEIQVNDQLLVRSGEVVPADGNLLTTAVLDESALTGEPLPRTRLKGDAVMSGVLNAGTQFRIMTSNTSEESTYAGIIRLVATAQAKSAPSVRIANKWALRFVPVALAMAAGAWLITGQFSRAVVVLVTATPCPLILAVPIAVVAGMSQAAKQGAVIKGGAILELLARVEVVLLDKTGTLTYGGPAVSEIATKPGIQESEILRIAASLDQYSPHIVAKAIVNAANERGLVVSAATEIHEEHGHGITGIVDSQQISVGQREGEVPDWCTLTHPLLVAVTVDESLIGIIGLSDPLRAEAKSMVNALRESGVKRVLLVTGDRIETAQSVADSVGITEVHASVSAAGKLALVRQEMEQSSGTVVVVGDGINDAPALAAADVGIAMGARGATAASEVADIVIVEDSIDRLSKAISTAKNARNKALQAAGLGMLLSLFAMTAGSFGVLNAGQGAVIQEFIDVIAILWALTTLIERSSKRPPRLDAG